MEGASLSLPIAGRVSSGPRSQRNILWLKTILFHIQTINNFDVFKYSVTICSSFIILDVAVPFP